MFTLIKNDAALLDIELDIMNSNPEYNLIAYDKPSLTTEDILELFQDAEELQIERYIVEKEGHPIALLDYGMSSPRHQKPWLSLLIVHQNAQGRGHAKEIYLAYEDAMKKRQAPCIHIAVHATNQKAIRFWTSLGFVRFDERTHEGKVFLSFEKVFSY